MAKMFQELCTLVFLIWFSVVSGDNQQWDIAIAIEEQIQFLHKNGTLVGIYEHKFQNIKALTYNEVKNELMVSDSIGDKDVIYKIPLSHQKSIVPMVKDITDDVKALAIDPVEDILYWADSFNKRILKYSNGSYSKELKFDTEIPFGIAADSCRRNIYWTNADHLNSSITYSDFNGTALKVIAKGNMFMPAAITIDQGSRRIFWADMGEGIYFRLESARLDGDDRRIIYEDTHQKPVDIAVDEDFVYWTDSINKALWRLEKNQLGAKPEILRQFDEKPSGLYVKSTDYLNIPECENLIKSMHNHEEDQLESEISSAYESLQCLNNGLFLEHTGRCVCPRGFTGQRCEINLCHNYCINGECAFTTMGYPKCVCKPGIIGSRCELEMCNGFCLNGGSCGVNATQPRCKCPVGYTGRRCEKTVEPKMPVCQCEGGVIIMPQDGNKPYCRCSYEIPNDNHTTMPDQPLELTSDGIHLMERVKDPIVLAFMFATIILMLVITALSIMVFKNRNQRPRIKKRIIVSKNITPLTCRPNNPPTEQCEITIENCCNMNICETPCFEPASLRGYQRTKQEEKKTLLTSMENGEDLY